MKLIIAHRSLAFRSLATAALCTAIAMEIHHSFMAQVSWQGYSLYSNSLSYFQVPWWIAAVAGLWSKNRGHRVWTVLGLVWLFGHAMLLNAGGNQLAYGIPYLLLAIIAGASTALADTRRPRSHGKILSFDEGMRRVS